MSSESSDDSDDEDQNSQLWKQIGKELKRQAHDIQYMSQKDGSNEFQDSGAVGGINKYGQEKSRRDELEESEMSDWDDDERNHGQANAANP